MPKPIAAYFTDTHLSTKNYELNLSIYDQIYDLCDELGIKDIIHGGDVFDSRKSQTQDNLSFFRQRLNDARDRGLKIHLLPGNHDKTDYESEDSFLDPFEHHPALNLHRDLGMFIPDEAIDMIFHMVPYFDEKELYAKYLSKAVKQVDENRMNILVTHIAVNGVTTNDGFVIENDLGVEMFDNFDQVIVGHYHDRSFLKPNITYAGAAFQHNFGEDEDKGFLVFYDDGSCEPYNSEFPKFKKISIDVSRATGKEIDDLRDEHTDSDDNIRFEFVGDSDALSAIDKNKFASAGIDVKFKSNESEQNLKDAENEEFVSFDEEAIKKEFNEFLIDNGMSDVEIAEGRGYLDKALNLAKE